MPSDFYEDLIQSGWYGWINEVGLGVPLASEIYKHKGASNLIHKTMSTYAAESRHIKTIVHWVSEQAVILESKALFEKLQKEAPVSRHKKLFAYSASGAYKETDERGETHMWCALTYISHVNRFGEPRLQTDTFHAWIPKRNPIERAHAFKLMLDAHEWFLKGVLLDKKLTNPGYPLQSPVFIDAVNSPLYPLEQAVDLVAGPNVCIFRPEHGDVVMCRSHDTVRAKPAPFLHNSSVLGQSQPLRIYRGSFNPFHKGHEALAGPGLGWSPMPMHPILEISLQNYWGKPVEMTDIAHRVRMLCGMGYTVMISRCITFDCLTEILHYLGSGNIEYLVGAEVFNAILNPKDGFDPRSITNIKYGSGVKFIVSERRCKIDVPDDNKKLVDYFIMPEMPIDKLVGTLSSTQVRDAKDLHAVPSSVEAYIKEHHLYGV